jgi:hypothetical protein
MSGTDITIAASPLPSDPGEVAAELGAIRAAGRSGSSLYTDKAVSDRQLALIELQLAAKRRGDVVERGSRAEPGVIDGDPGEAILKAVPELDRQAFATSFQQLGGDIPLAVVSELSWGIPRVAPASREQVSLFASTPEGAQVIKEWGARAPQNVAIIAERYLRALSVLPEDEADDLAEWFERLPPSHAAAIYRSMVRR